MTAVIQVNTYPLSDIVIGSLNDSDLVTCGTCGKKFPDIYPSARCPYEYEHPRKWPTDEAGCLIGGHHGWHGHAYMIDLAVQSGYPMTEKDTRALDIYRGNASHDAASQHMLDQGGLMDKAEEWMNKHCAPEGYSFGWHEGEFFLAHNYWWYPEADGNDGRDCQGKDIHYDIHGAQEV
jgi:hypothetical protein